MTTSSAGPSLGLVVLTLTSLSAGFLAANVPVEETTRAIGQIDSARHAYGVDLDAGEEFVLSLPDPGSADARLAVFDPADRFVDNVRLEAGGETTLTATSAGVWVLYPTAAPPANLTVGVPDDQTEVPHRPLHRLDLRTIERPLTASNGSAIEVRESTSLDRLPARTYLAVDGTVRGLNATVRAPGGTVFEVAQATVNESTPRLADRSTPTAAPGNADTGTYAVEASADALDGELSLVHATYERPDQARPPVEVGPAELAGKGIPVADVGEGQAVVVDAQRAREIRLATASETSARILVYESDDDVDTIAHVGGTRDYEWDWTNRSRPAFRTSTLPIDGSRSYVLYAEAIEGKGENLYVLLPGLRTAEGGRELGITRTQVVLDAGPASDGQTRTSDVVLEGGLVEVDVEVDDAYGGGYEIQVDGPEGVVFERSTRNSVAGQPTSTSGRVSEAHFSDGNFTVTLESRQSVDAEVRVSLYSYTR